MLYRDTEIEPRLRPVEEQTLNPGANRNDGARSDIRIMGFQREFQNTHLDVKVINLQAQCHVENNPNTALARAEEQKERAYKERIERVENGSFVRMIFSTRGAKSNKTTKALARIAKGIAYKNRQEVSVIARNIGIELSFILLRMELACLRGYRGARARLNTSA